MSHWAGLQAASGLDITAPSPEPEAPEPEASESGAVQGPQLLPYLSYTPMLNGTVRNSASLANNVLSLAASSIAL